MLASDNNNNNTSTPLLNILSDFVMLHLFLPVMFFIFSLENGCHFPKQLLVRAQSVETMNTAAAIQTMNAAAIMASQERVECVKV